MINLAIFGAGRIGRVHAVNAASHPSVRLKYLIEPIETPQRAELAARTGAELADAARVFADPEIDGVIIASSTDTHASLVLKALAARKAVFCEKPISLDFATVEEVSDSVDASGVACMIGFQRRYDPNFRAVREHIIAGTAGRLEQLVMHTRDPSPPPIAYVKVSGGMLRDQAIHDFDQARYMTGEEIVSVHAVGDCRIDPAIGEAGDIDIFAATLLTESGCIVQMSNSRRSPLGYDQRLEAHCAKEVLFIDNRPRADMRIAGASGSLSAPPMDYFITRFEAAYRDEMTAFVELIESGRKPLAGIRDGLEAQRLAEAAVVSIATGRPVDIGPDWRPAQPC